jgi:thiamine pyrophosphokinase
VKKPAPGSKKSPVKRALIIANGEVPAPGLVRPLLRTCDLIVCADGGANTARKLGIIPDIILGDLDSMTAATRRHFRNVPLLRIAEQENTDLEKALLSCVRWGIQSVDVVGATGGRIDHTAAAMGCFRRFGSRIVMEMHDSSGTLSRAGRHVRIPVGKGRLVSLLPLGKCSGVSTRNLKYALRNAVLEPGIRQGVSNRSTALWITVSVRRGTLLIFIPHPGRGPG